MKLEEGLTKFHEAMLTKFYDRAEKQGDRSVTVVGDNLLQEQGTYIKLWAWLLDEVKELQEASQEEEAAEAVDVANMAFLIWWANRAEDKPQPAKEVR